MNNKIFIARNQINSLLLCTSLLLLFVFFTIKGFYPIKPSIGVNVSETSMESAKPMSLEPFIISLTKNGEMYVHSSTVDSSKSISLEELKRVIDGLDKTQQIFLRADKSLSYETVVNVLGLIQTVGGLEVGLVTDDSPEKPEVAPE
ncbi:biopolymer transporter ExbD [Oceanospirillaceae bacterium]|jgi:biopolymer transport protein ExbD|nr:biopolymer transporter ExbD [Oceanospirillaceae bacterium]